MQDLNLQPYGRQSPSRESLYSSLAASGPTASSEICGKGTCKSKPHTVCGRTYLCMYVQMCVYVYMYMYMHMYMNMYVCMYVYIGVLEFGAPEIRGAEL